jgi:hypothetical protein
MRRVGVEVATVQFGIKDGGLVCETTLNQAYALIGTLCIGCCGFESRWR